MPVPYTEADHNRDALNILPLDTIPLDTPGLKKAKLIKNARLQTMVELFNEEQSGSGQIEINGLPEVFLNHQDQLAQDIKTLKSLSQLGSFDVYSLRIDLRHLGVEVNHSEQLRLSATKQAELSSSMAVFTMPLIYEIYGAEQQRISDMTDIIKLFASPNRDEALKNLQLMASKLDVEVHELPAFIEEYGDVFLSLMYFREEFNKILPHVKSYLKCAEDIKSSLQVKNDAGLSALINNTAHQVEFIATSLDQRMQTFQKKFESIWEDANRVTFDEIKELITSNHKSIGSVLCGLSVKMQLWASHFPSGKPPLSKMIEFTRNEIAGGLQEIYDYEKKAATLDAA